MSAELFLNSIGACTKYNMLYALVLPNKPPQLTYDEIIAASETDFCPKNILVSQHKFLSTYQAGK